MPETPDPDRRERELRFTDGEMALFAAASGDRSPLHTDPAFARRTAFGECIVYGGLETLAMLSVLPGEVRSRIRSVRSLFPGPVLPGERCTARARCRPGRPDEWEVRLSGRGRVLARVLTSAAARAPGVPDRAHALARVAATAGASSDADAGSGGDAGGGRAPEGPAPGLEITGDYRPGPELRELAARFGIKDVDPALLDGIAWASNVVGMTIPGFDGLCAAVTIVAGEPGQGTARQWIRVRDHDQRTDRVLLEGALVDDQDKPRCLGLIECFPFGPTPLAQSAGLTGPEPLEPLRGTVVVVGASRGAGAALALALLAGGYAVHAVYAQAAAAAERLRQLAGPYATRLFLHRADAGDPAAVGTVLDLIDGPIDGLALCAAPPALPMTLTADSAAGLAAYVQRSVALAAVPLAAFMPKLDPAEPWILFCSAAAVTEPARDLPQFTAAKAALEGLAQWAATALPGARVLVARLPKMRTDLVNTPSGRRHAAPPQAVAAAIARRLTDDTLDRGVSVITPDPSADRALTP